MIFRVRALGQAVSGHVDVADDHVRVEVMLPWLLQRFAQAAQAAIKIAPQDSSATFDGTTVAGSWTAQAVCISATLLKDFIALRIAWHEPP